MLSFVERLAAACAALLVAVACGTQSPAPSSGSLILGEAIAQTGFLAPFDVPASLSLSFAIQDINAKGGILGRQVKAVFADTKSVPANGTSAALQVINQGAQIVIVSCDFDFGSPAAIAAAGKGLLSFSLCAGSTRFGEPLLPMSYTLNDPDINDGTVGANFAYTNKGFRSVYILKDTCCEYTTRVSDYFNTVWKSLTGTKIVGEDTFANSDPSIASQITRIKSLAQPPDFIYLGSLTPGGASALRQIRAAGINLPVVAGNGMDGTYWNDAVPNLSNFFVTYIRSTLGDDPNTAVNALVARFIATTGQPPQHSTSLNGYSVLEAIDLAATRANSLDPKAMQAQLNKFTNENFLVGPTTFTPQYHCNLFRPMAVIEVEKGVSKFLTYVTPTNLPTVMP
jgi:branched-chain amino acid transport system substrate-binding protein